MPTLTTEIPNFIKQLGHVRTQRALTQNQVARKLGITQSMLAQYENGHRLLRCWLLLDRWADTLGLEIVVQCKKSS